MATSKKATKKEKKKALLVKAVLNNPYDVKWKSLESGNARLILKTVTEKLDSLGLRKQHGKVVRKWRSRRKAKKGNSDSVDTNEPIQESQKRRGSDSMDINEPIQESQKRRGSDSVDTNEPIQESQKRGGSDSVDTNEPIQESQERGWTDKHLRNELAIGINEVTKGLEKNELGLVLVCDSVQPLHMTSHLIPLSQTRSVPACQVPSLSTSLASSLGLSSVLALGFKRQSGAFADMIAALAPKVPPQNVAWIPAGTRASEPEVVQVSEKTEESWRVRKRKREDSPDVQKDQVPSLQPLQVKRIIPNPSKIRKPKIKKAKQK
ncbi:ribonuclease P protein subunit p38 [Neoarius graeffei]|uniref:ribonuclease P protein subunit p38 n=1 Tax=Neoarius graeffei TaxID=443677 RepID=UPI00298D1136|nr:ribonuclease P protein subunit p38 [Neoarius graeffei]